MVNFYRKGSLETNGVIVNPNHHMKDDSCGTLIHTNKVVNERRWGVNVTTRFVYIFLQVDH